MAAPCVESMNTPASSSRRVHAGLFEIDLRSGEVHKSGRKVALQEQPFRVLAMLLEHPGEVVSREELQSRLWPADTYVGFDEGINTAIRKLRQAFGDSADNPRFIETVPRRGYRFIAPVDEIRPLDSIRTAEGVAGVAPNTGTTPDTPAESLGPDGAKITPNLEPAKVSAWRSPKVVVAAAAALVLLLLVTGVGYLLRPRRAADSVARKRIMLAILPFQNLSKDSGQEYFSDGLTEETITDLGQLSPEQLGVIARTSAMAYKHTDKTISQIGQDLGVDYILEGSVRREGGKARISAQLIRVSDQTHLWAENYDRDLNDVLEIESELGRTIAQEVQLNLTPQRQIALSRTRTIDPEAYDLYLKGRYYWNQRTPVGIKESMAYFQQAVARDPDFALAYAGMADAYNISNIVGAYTAKESLPQARAAAEKAIQLDPSLAEAHAALGMEKSHYEFDFPGAEREFLKAIELNPNSAYAHLFYSNCYLLPMGRTAEAIAENQKALALDPLSLPIHNFMGMSYYFAGDYEKAYQQYQHTIAMDPTFPLAHEYFSALLITMGRYEQAIQEKEQSELLGGMSPKEAAAEAEAALNAFRNGGAKGYWQGILEMTLARQNHGKESVVASDMVVLYALVGDKDKAFSWLDKAYDAREGAAITLLKCDPYFKNLRGDPRFLAMLRRMGLPA
jgi:TolB-like protein/DNA-binding winged helix-turn-helix (wHTH) protein/Flp pilus assembly protein TadD